MALSIWNQLDEVALYQSLERSSGETDEDFFIRMKKFAKWRCKTDYRTQAHTIPIQAGLLTYPIMDITCKYPFEVKLDWEYFTIQNYPTDGSKKEYARIFININDSAIDKITSILDTLRSFKYIVRKPEYRKIHQKFFIREHSIRLETDFVYTKGTCLTYKNVLDGSLRPDSTLYCKDRKNSIQEIKKRGDYFFDAESGYIEIYEESPDGFFVSYRRYHPRVSIEATELNLIPMSVLMKYGLTDESVELFPYMINGKIWGN